MRKEAVKERERLVREPVKKTGEKREEQIEDVEFVLQPTACSQAERGQYICYTTEERCRIMIRKIRT